jgi:hypothetical protein
MIVEENDLVEAVILAISEMGGVVLSFKSISTKIRRIKIHPPFLKIKY